MKNLLENYDNDIQGVVSINSVNPGPILAISACTHGGETVGLEVIDYLLNQIDLRTNLIKGEIYFILSNIKAYEKSLELKKNGDPDYIINSRYVDENMNRCCSIESLDNPINYERSRVNQLKPILEKLDYHFDIHSTMNPSGSMFIHTEKSQNEFGDVFNTDEVYIKLPETVIGKPLIDVVRRNGGVGMAIETGNQTNKDGYKVGIDNVLRLLVHLGMIDNTKIDKMLLLPNKANEKFYIIGSIMITTNQFKPVKEFANLEFVKKGEIVAYDSDKAILVPDDCYIIMPSNKHFGEEYCFLAQKIL